MVDGELARGDNYGSGDFASGDSLSGAVLRRGVCTGEFCREEWAGYRLLCMWLRASFLMPIGGTTCALASALIRRCAHVRLLVKMCVYVFQLASTWLLSYYTVR